MNLLLDFLTLSVKTGAGEYLRRVIYEIIHEYPYICLYALYDSKLGISYDDLRSEEFAKKNRILFVDCKDKKIVDIVESYNIDKLFIACGQYFRGRNDLSNVKCEVICVIHDLYGEENVRNKIYIYLDLIKRDSNEKWRSKRKWLDFLINRIPIIRNLDNFSLTYLRNGGSKYYEKYLEDLKPVMSLCRANNNVKIITVSNYSKNSLIYNCNIAEERITVLYSPERVYYGHGPKINNINLLELLERKIKFFLMVSANREAKNPLKVISAFRKYSELNKDCYLVTVGSSNSEFQNHISIPFLCDSDLCQLYQHCYALIFPSFFEGFGYPPLEVMKYGKPVLCSNTTSMPEIFENSVIYFSPFYESAIFNALLSLTPSNYIEYSKKSLFQYEKVRNRQIADLHTLVSMIVA